MPVRNEEEYIERALRSVLAQDWPAARLEVVVADGLSTDATRARVAAFVREGAPVRLVENPGRTAPTGLNAALRVARGDVVIRVDGHCEIAPDYVSACVRHLLVDGVDVVGGPIETVGEDALSRTIAVAMSSRFGVGGSAFRTVSDRSLLVDTVPFSACRRSLLERAGPFDEELVRNQDDEYNYRLRKMGARILLSKDVHSRYYARTSLARLARQYFQYGFWKVRVLQKHPFQLKARQFVPPAFVLALVLAGAAAVALPAGRVALAGLVAAYASACILASLSCLQRVGPMGAVLLPAAFAALHLSYGAGFLLGLVRFAGRWTQPTPIPGGPHG